MSAREQRAKAPPPGTATQTAGTQIEDRRIYDAYIAGRQSIALAAAVRAGIFEALDREPMTAQALAAACGLQPRPVFLLTRVLRAMGLIVDEGERLTLSDDASAFLVRGRPQWLGGLIDLEIEHFLTPAVVLDALRQDRATVYGGVDPWERHAQDPEQARRFTVAMHSISVRPAQALARTVDLSGVRRLIDVGGGSGVVAVALARAWPETHCVVWEMATVCEVAREVIRDSEVEGRVTVLEGDLFRDPFPEGFDAVLFSQILHDWSLETGETLLRRAFAALNPGGVVLLHEKLISGDGRGPLANALVDLDMLVWTEGQQYDPGRLEALLERSGFCGFEVRPTTGYWSVAQARKPR
jgi:predicted O-methyltransferase YrrM